MLNCGIKLTALLPLGVCSLVIVKTVNEQFVSSHHRERTLFQQVPQKLYRRFYCEKLPLKSTVAHTWRLKALEENSRGRQSAAAAEESSRLL